MTVTKDDIISFLQSQIDKASNEIASQEHLLNICKVNQDYFLTPSIKKLLAKMRKEQKIRKDVINHYIIERSLDLQFQKWLEERNLEVPVNLYRIKGVNV